MQRVNLGPGRVLVLLRGLGLCVVKSGLRLIGADLAAKVPPDDRAYVPRGRSCDGRCSLRPDDESPTRYSKNSPPPDSSRDKPANGFDALRPQTLRARLV